MSSFPIQMLASAALALAITPAHANQCSQDVHETMVEIADRLTAIAEAGRTARETQRATMHRQPTPSSIAQAEMQLGELPVTAIRAYQESMQRVADADSANNPLVCRQALKDVRDALTSRSSVTQ
jgi:hypothetical protein